MNNPLAEKKHILALDIGTSKIMAGIALLNTTGGQCLSIGRANSQGIKKGMVVDMQKTIQAIAKARVLGIYNSKNALNPLTELLLKIQ